MRKLTKEEARRIFFPPVGKSRFWCVCGSCYETDTSTFDEEREKHFRTCPIYLNFDELIQLKEEAEIRKRLKMTEFF